MSQASSAGIPTDSLRLSGPTWSQDARLVALILLALYAGFTCFFGLRGGAPLGDHECINAYSARNILKSGEWLIPSMGEAPQIRKTPLGIWAIAAASAATGENTEWGRVSPYSARLPSALAAFAAVAVTCWLGVMLYGFRAGWVGGFIVAGCAATFMFARNAQVDMLLTLFTTACFALFWRGAACERPSRWAMVGFYVAFALAMMAKAPLPLATVGLSLAVYWFVAAPLHDTLDPATPSALPFFSRLRRQIATRLAGLRSMWLIPGTLLFLVLAGAWPLYVYLKMENALELWRIEYLARYSGELSSRAAWYYVPIVFALMVPYMLSIPEAVAAPVLPRYSGQRRGLMFVLTGALVGTVFLSTAAFKRPHYLLSLVPLYALMLAPVLDRLFFGMLLTGRRTVTAVCVAVPVALILCAAAGGIMVGRSFPQLMPVYYPAAAAAVVLWTAASWAFARDRRMSAFVLLNLGVPMMFLLFWPALAKGAGLNAEADALAAELKQRGIPVSGPLYWIEGQPTYVLPFYHGIPVRRLMDEIEIASFREGRSDVSDRVYLEIVRRLKEHIEREAHAHFAVSAQYFDLLSHRKDLAVREVFRLQGFHADPEDEYVVFTGS